MRHPRPLLFVSLLPAFVGCVKGGDLAAPDPIDGLRDDHPRLLATAADWEELRSRRENDAWFAAFDAALVGAAQRLLPEPPLRRELIGPRMLHISRDLVQRMLLLAYASQMTGDRAIAQRAETEMLAAAAFTDWNTSLFLDVAEVTAALAIGYDWCFDALTPEARAKIREAIAVKGIQPGLDPEAPHNFWHHRNNNWNQVCFAGLTLGALAIAEDEPELARTALALARAGIGRGLAAYAPDGVYPEGPGYWVYGTTYQVMMIAALNSALGTDWELAAQPGFMASAGAFLQMTAPSSNLFNFADGTENGFVIPVLAWFAREQRDPGMLLFDQQRIAEWLAQPDTEVPNYFLPLAAVWWPRDGSAIARGPNLPLRWHGGGTNPIAVFRESWTDAGSLYLAIKGGAAELNHAHMDAGSFVLELDGVRWAVDLGLQKYESLETKGIDLWNRAQDSQRWQVYRLNNHGHGTLTIDDQPHRVDGYATITEFSGDEAEPHAVVDLSPVFAGQAARVRRSFKLLPGRRILIQDELAGLAAGSSVRWQMLTRADVAIDGSQATLRQNGRSLRAELRAETPASFAVAPAQPPEDGFNAPNPGVSVLSATLLAPPGGSLRFEVLLAPGTPDVATPGS